MKTFVGKTPYAGTPEERHGTRSYFAYARTDDMTCAVVRATTRQWKKAGKIFERAHTAGRRNRRGHGRVQRALLRELANRFGEWADSRFYGGR